MSVIGNNFDPRYGFTPGGVVSIVTKSGTNAWHGDVFDFYRNGGFNAEDYFTHETNAIHRNQFGGSLGGPVIKDKFFVFGNYQGTRQSLNEVAGSGFTWTPNMLQGNFSALCQNGFTNGLCNDRDSTNTYVTDQLWQPGQDPNNFNNGYNNADVTPAYALAHPSMIVQGNQLTNLDPTAVNMATILSTGLTPINSFGSVIGVSYPEFNNFNEETIRGDYNLNDKNRISARGFLDFFNQLPYGGCVTEASDQQVLAQSLSELRRNLDVDGQLQHRVYWPLASTRGCTTPAIAESRSMARVSATRSSLRPPIPRPRLAQSRALGYPGRIRDGRRLSYQCTELQWQCQPLDGRVLGQCEHLQGQAFVCRRRGFPASVLVRKHGLDRATYRRL